MAKEKSKQEISNEVLCAEYEAVYRYVFSLCRNETQAQDITQETFLKAMKAYQTFEGASSLYTWLCAIAKNLWLNHCKKSRREICSDEMISVQTHTIQNQMEVSVETNILEKDATLHIYKIVHQLQEPYKEVFSLRVFGQLSFTEIAKLFSKTESWARVTYHRARKMIAEKMRKDGFYE